MAFQDLAERSRRIMDAAMREANSGIQYLTTALHVQEAFGNHLLGALYRRDMEANEMSIRLADQALLIAQLREQNNTLRTGLASERLQSEVFREELESERLLSTQMRDALLYGRENNLDASLPHVEPALPEAVPETAEPVAPQTNQAAVPATLASVPMTKESAYRRHGEPKAE